MSALPPCDERDVRFVPIADIAYSQPKIKGPPIKGPIRKEAPALQLGLSVGWRRKVSARTELNQPLVTTGAGALPLPIGPLPTQAVRPKARAIEQITTNNFLIGHPR